MNQLRGRDFSRIDRLVVASEDVSIVKEALRKEGNLELAEKVTARPYDGAKPITRTEARELGEAAREQDPSRLNGLLQQRRSFAHEAHSTGIRAAKAGAAIGAAISLVRNTIAVSRGDKKAADAAISVAVDTAKGGARAYAIGATSVGVRKLAERVGAQAIVKSAAAPAAIATALVEVGALTVRFANGEIGREEYVQRCGGVAVSSMSGFYVGAAAGAIFGPPGAIIGSIAGYMISSLMYECLLKTFAEERMTRDRRREVESLCWSARRSMTKARRELRELTEAYYTVRFAVLGTALREFDLAIAATNHSEAFVALQRIGRQFNSDLQLVGFNEFSEMLAADEDRPLVIGAS